MSHRKNDYIDRNRAHIAAGLRREVELNEVRREAHARWQARFDPSPAPVPAPTEPAPGWRARRPRELVLNPLLDTFGRYLRRARYYVGWTQDDLEAVSGVTQSLVSRAERARAPAMRLDRLTRLGAALGRALPLGYCPHQHDCAWQPIVAPEFHATPADRLEAFMLGYAGRPSADEDTAGEDTDE